VLDVAERRGLVRRNVVRLVEPPRLNRPAAPDALTVGAAREILAKVRGDRLEALFVVTLAAGLRQAEVLGLRWSEVDLDASTLRISASLDRVAGRYVLTDPKTPKSERTVALPAFAVAALREHRRRQLEARLAAGEATAEGLVFVSPAGRPINGGWLSHRWPRFGLSLTFHDLRHGQSSLLVALGVHPKIIAERLGHTTIAESMDRYAHVARASDVEAAERLQDALG